MAATFTNTITNLLFSQSPEKAMRALCDDVLANYISAEGIKEIYSAFEYADQAHRGQTRKSGEHYIHHPIEVAATLAELQMDVRSIIAALLHDVIEDTLASKQDIEALFGSDVALLVDGVSKIEQIQFENREHAEAENFRKMLMAMSKDVRVMIIKLADRLHNMRTLEAMRRDKQRRISEQTLRVYAPIAERLGLYQWAKELQDLCFRYLYPKRHTAITKAIAGLEGNRKQIIEKLHASLSEALTAAGVSDFKILGRRKAVFSIYKKMVKKRKSFKELHDIYGFRIIVQDRDDCYRILGIIHNTYKPIPGRFDDYIAIPKANGYQSLHTVVFGPLGDNIEMQIRTQEMDQVAEAGVAAHWIYKSGSSEDEGNNHLARQWLLDLLDPAHHTGNPVEFLEHLKTDLYPDEVYVFTPKGDIKKMPRGSTALDFAFAVHSDIGTHCTGARINRSLASLPTVLRNGDMVEIMTAKNSWPNTAWLNYAVTAKARTSIRNFLKKQTEEDALKLGKRLLAGATKQRLFGRRKVSAAVEQQLLENLGIETWRQLLVEVGLGLRLPDMIARQIAQLSDVSNPDGKVIGEEALIVKGSEGLLLTYSRCCCPIPGDPILGTFTAGHGLVLHTTDCPNTSELRKHPERCLMVEWDDRIAKDFHVKIQVKLKHVAGAFAKVATAIAENQSNIINVDLHDGPDSVRQIDFVIDVKNRVHLAQVIRAIRNQRQVQKVTRHKG